MSMGFVAIGGMAGFVAALVALLAFDASWGLVLLLWGGGGPVGASAAILALLLRGLAGPEPADRQRSPRLPA
ncbi:hypothetical protein [Rubellimicrobium sp. CFH 75288]|uniref:hypothetical protein n=1 Tax=Rubellimicrobium sp. CFH 75288 TaxID=2697034 RepID=UPI001411DF39|nr:hypothetical protein [Rubellimicrobium sp. CFH 75288]NAZ37503.1 hypothetical protein [Rubellimicrobium sp. CFH 75288]